MARKSLLLLASLCTSLSALTPHFLAPPSQAMFLPPGPPENGLPFAQQVFRANQRLLRELPAEGPLPPLPTILAAEQLVDLERTTILLNRTLSVLFPVELRLNAAERRYIQRRLEEIFRKEYEKCEITSRLHPASNLAALRLLQQAVWEQLFEILYGSDARGQRLENLRPSIHQVIQRYFEKPGSRKGPFAPTLRGGFAERFEKAWFKAYDQLPRLTISATQWNQLALSLSESIQREGPAPYFPEAFRFLLAHLSPPTTQEGRTIAGAGITLEKLSLLPYWPAQYQPAMDQAILLEPAQIYQAIRAGSLTRPLQQMLTTLAALHRAADEGEPIGLSTILAPSPATAKSVAKESFLATIPRQLQRERERLEQVPLAQMETEKYLHILRQELAFRRLSQGVLLLDKTLGRLIPGTLTLHTNEQNYLRKYLNKIVGDFYRNLMETPSPEESNDLLKTQRMTKLFWHNLFYLLIGKEEWVEGVTPIRTEIHRVMRSYFYPELTAFTGPFSPYTRLASFTSEFMKAWRQAYDQLPALPLLSDKAYQLLLREVAKRTREQRSTLDLMLTLLSVGNLPASEGSLYARFQKKLASLLLLPTWDPVIRKHLEKLLLTNHAGLLRELQAREANGPHLQAVARGIDIFVAPEPQAQMQPPEAGLGGEPASSSLVTEGGLREAQEEIGERGELEEEETSRRQREAPSSPEAHERAPGAMPEHGGGPR